MNEMSVQVINPSNASAVDVYDVIIVGAGISGISAGYHLQKEHPELKIIILETLSEFGGTWRSHNYPGIRSDSDLHTFGYSFKPWTGKPIATADEILKYMDEVIEENQLNKYIHYNHKVLAAAWESESNMWALSGLRTDNEETFKVRTRFLYMAQGYYRHRQGYTPDWQDIERFKGTFVHAEEWPESLDYKNKEVVVIGSGATAATIVPAMAGIAKHVTILQRSPTYFFSGRNGIELAEELRKLGVDETWIHEIVRKKILFDQDAFMRRSRDEPDKVRQELLGLVKTQLPDGFDMTHFTPRYRPWQQRLAFVPDGDLFKCINNGQVSIVTDEIDRFDERGIQLKSGRHLDADLIVAATGFNICPLGDIDFTVDGKKLDLHDTVTYRGMMFTGLPNLVWVFGYFRASWTLRSDLIAGFVCRLLTYMQEHGYKSVVPALRAEDLDEPKLDWLQEQDFDPGYIRRGTHLLPRRLNKPEWMHTQDYWSDKDIFPRIDFNDSIFQFK